LCRGDVGWVGGDAHKSSSYFFSQNIHVKTQETT